MRFFSEVPTVYLHREAVDFRKSINGLSVIIETQMHLSPFEDALFVFCNKQRDKVKALLWDKTGFVLFYKRLEKERFKWPKGSASTLTINNREFHALLDGFDIIGHQPLYFGSNA